MARRSRTGRENIERIVREYAGSGQTRREFCQQHGIAEHTLHYYQRRVRELAQVESGPGTRLARVEVKESAPLERGQRVHAPIAVVLNNGRRLEFTDWQQRQTELARLIRLVEEA